MARKHDCIMITEQIITYYKCPISGNHVSLDATLSEDEVPEVVDAVVVVDVEDDAD